MVQRRYIMKLYIIHKRPTELTVKQNKKKKATKERFRAAAGSGRAVKAQGGS